MARTLEDGDAPTPGPPTETLLGGAFVGEGADDEELVGRELVVVGGIGDGRVQQLDHRLGRATIAEPQPIASLVDVDAPDEPKDRADLVRRDREVAKHGARLTAFELGGNSHGAHRLPERSWPAWTRKVRVGANSPSLWPTIGSEM